MHIIPGQLCGFLAGVGVRREHAFADQGAPRMCLEAMQLHHAVTLRDTCKILQVWKNRGFVNFSRYSIRGVSANMSFNIAFREHQ